MKILLTIFSLSLLFLSNSLYAILPIYNKGTVSDLDTIIINTNGGFEEAVLGPVTEVTGWTMYSAAPASAYFEIVDQPVFEGSKALMVVTDALGANPWDIQVVNEPFTVNPNTKYTYSIWAKSDVVGAVVNFTVGEPVTYSEWGRAHQVVLNDLWQQIKFDFTTPSSASQGRAPIHLSEGSNSSLLPITYYFDDLKIYEIVTDLKNESNLPFNYSLSQNYPNPFNPETTIEFSLPVNSYVYLSVYDVLGREVKVLVSGNYTAGNYKVNLNANDLTSGIYFYKLQANNFVSMKKMIVIK